MLAKFEVWITGKRLGQAWTQTRKFFKNTYHERRKWAHTIDSYAQLLRRGLSAAALMLTDLSVGVALGSGVKALHSYESVRKKVIDVDERTEASGQNSRGNRMEEILLLEKAS